MGLNFDQQIASGVAPFTAAPILLTNPVTGALAAALAALTPPSPPARAYRVLDAGSVTITAGVTAGGTTATWSHLAGEGYALPLTDVIASASRVLVFY